MNEKKCTKCGKIFYEEAAFCDECGGKVDFAVSNVKPTAGYVCSKCGKAFYEEAAFCDECGGKVNNTGVNVSSSEEYTKAYKILTLIPYTGCFGIHRFYKKDYVWGIIYLFTLGLVFCGWIYDVVNVIKNMRK